MICLTLICFKGSGTIPRQERSTSLLTRDLELTLLSSPASCFTLTTARLELKSRLSDIFFSIAHRCFKKAYFTVRTKFLMYVLQEKVQRTYNWVMSQDSKAASPVPMMSERRHSQGRDNLNLEKTTSSLDIRPPSIGVNCNFSNPVVSKPFTLPNSAISSVLDNVWSDKGVLSRLVPAKC